ncbi:MAG: hypothetical protein CM1200mP2_46770 [Planctomycetaceae bacterium]|nr:MAG: hypothetical protein CM1200mP2_46770 [Planctomycetaceae bacterium]
MTGVNFQAGDSFPGFSGTKGAVLAQSDTRPETRPGRRCQVARPVSGSRPWTCRGPTTTSVFAEAAATYSIPSRPRDQMGWPDSRFTLVTLSPSGDTRIACPEVTSGKLASPASPGGGRVSDDRLERNGPFERLGSRPSCAQPRVPSTRLMATVMPVPVAQMAKPAACDGKHAAECRQTPRTSSRPVSLWTRGWDQRRRPVCGARATRSIWRRCSTSVYRKPPAGTAGPRTVARAGRGAEVDKPGRSRGCETSPGGNTHAGEILNGGTELLEDGMVRATSCEGHAKSGAVRARVGR